MALKNYNGLTSDKIRSHLQKFRNRKEKSHQEFIDLYKDQINELKAASQAHLSPQSSVGHLQKGTEIIIPCVSEAAEASPVNAIMGHLKGMLFVLQSEILDRKSVV